MPDSGVGLDKEKALAKEMSRLGIRQVDITENFIRSKGPGGQNVNKTSTCVYLKHLPTGIEVKCQRERSQALNRYIARQILLKKIETLILGKLSQERQRIEKIKRQKRRRSRKAKLKILEVKRRNSEKKQLRAKVRQTEGDE
jgi:protein subunit release factor B